MNNKNDSRQGIETLFLKERESFECFLRSYWSHPVTNTLDSSVLVQNPRRISRKMGGKVYVNV